MLKKLGPRLDKIVQLLAPGLPVWDLCCDHGYVGRRALEKELTVKVNFVDAVPEIVEALEKKVRDRCQFDDGAITFYRSRAEDLDWDSVSGNVVITGVGVDSIISILDAIPDSRVPHCRFILGPQNRPERLRSYILARGMPFELSDEWIVREGVRYRHLFLSGARSH